MEKFMNIMKKTAFLCLFVYLLTPVASLAMLESEENRLKLSSSGIQSMRVRKNSTILNEILSFDKAKELFESSNEKDKKKGRKALRLMAQADKGLYSVNTAKILFASATEEDKAIGRTILHYSGTNPQGYIDTFSERYRERVLEEVIVYQTDIINFLKKQEDEESHHAAEDVFNKMYESAIRLVVGGSGYAENRLKGLRSLELISSNSHEGSKAYKCIEALLFHGDKEHKEFALSRLTRLVEDKSYILKYDAAIMLCSRWNSDAGFKSMQLIAQQAGHPMQFKAAKFLYEHDYYGYQPIKGHHCKEVGEKTIKFIAQQKGHPNQKEANDALSICRVM